MPYCTNCGAFVPDGTPVCPNCSAAVNAGVNPNIYNQQAAQNQGGYQQPQQPNPAVQGVPYYDPYMQQETYKMTQEASTAKTLGIVSIVCAVLSSFIIACWICGGIGLSKAKEVILFAKATGNMQLLAEAESAKHLNKIGLIISFVIVGLAVLAGVLFAVLGVSALNGTAGAYS